MNINQDEIIEILSWYYTACDEGQAGSSELSNKLEKTFEANGGDYLKTFNFIKGTVNG